MVFSSLSFMYLFLPIVLLIYFASSNKIRNVIIFISGLIFYAWGEPVYIFVMIISSAVDYTAGLIMDKYDDNPRIRKLALVFSMIIDLGFLMVFKYTGFFVENINAFFNTNIENPDLPLPIGISFYTFQSMSYTIDLYKREIKVQKSFVNFISYVSLFPQLVAGPIVRYSDVQNEIDSRKVNATLAGEGVEIFIKGLAKKVLLANGIGELWTIVKAMDYSELSAATAWLGILSFTFQIYFDFSGYSDMAVGLGKMLGFNFPKNFDHPYISKSISEFWRRWHITMGSWFKSYIYIPLGGNRHGTLKTIRNMFVVWAVTGFWHGASWNFILWGIYFGVLQMLERFCYGKYLEKAGAAVQTIYSFVLVVFGWVLFDTNTLSEAGAYMKAMVGGNGLLADGLSAYYLKTYAVLFILCIIGSTDLVSNFVKKLSTREKTAKFYYYALPVVQLAAMLVCTAYLVDATYNPFLYFRF